MLKYCLAIGISIPFYYSYGQDTTRMLKPVPIMPRDSVFKMAVVTSAVPMYELSSVKLDQLGETDVGSSLKYVPGIQLKDYGGVGGLKTVSFRSIGASHTAVSMDGIQVPNTQTGVIDLSTFELFGVNTIIFSTGQPNADIVSASAFINTNQVALKSILFNEGDFKVIINSRTSTISNFENGFLVHTPILKRKGGFGIQGTLRNGKGNYPFKFPTSGTDSVFSRTNAALLSYKIRTGFYYRWLNSRLELSYSVFDQEQELPGAVVLYNPYNDQKLWQNYHRGTAQFKHYFAFSYLKLSVFYHKNYTRYLDPTYPNLEGFLDNDYTQDNFGGGFMFRTLIGNVSDNLFIGSDLISTRLRSNNISGNPLRLQNNSVVGVHVKTLQGRMKIQSNISLQYIADQQFSADSSINKTYLKASPFLALYYNFMGRENWLSIRSFYKRAFRMPSFNDLYYNQIGNTNLVPEEANLYNLGITYGRYKEKFRFEMTVDAYYNQLWNKIIAIPTKNIFVWSMTNIGRVNATGMDVSCFAEFDLKNWQIKISTNQNINSSVDNTDSDNLTYGHQIPYTPKYTGNYGLSVMWKGYGFTTNLIYSGSRYSLGENIPANYLDDFYDLNFGLHKGITFKNEHELLLKFQAMNVLNNNYEVIRSFPMPGRYYRFTIKYMIQ